MDTREFVNALAAFVELAEDAEAAHARAVEQEQANNDATQDILHVAELQPERFAETNLLETLHKLRVDRREAKKELEVTDIFANWAKQNRKAINVLAQNVGAMKKVLARQPLAMYCLKTNIAGDKGSWITRTIEEEAPAGIEFPKEEGNGGPNTGS